MTADDLALQRPHIAGLRGQELLQKRLEMPLADEAHARGILLFAVGQTGFLRDFAHLRLGQAADREHRLFQRVLPEHIEEVALVFVAVRSAQKQLFAVRRVAELAEMPRRQPVRAELHRKIQKRLEFDLPIAEHVGVRRAPAPVFVEEIGKHAVVIFLDEIDGVIRNIDLFADAAHVRPVRFAGADAVVVLLFPVFHKHADDLMPGAFEQERGHGGIHAAGHAHHDSCHFTS